MKSTWNSEKLLTVECVIHVLSIQRHLIRSAELFSSITDFYSRHGGQNTSTGGIWKDRKQVEKYDCAYSQDTSPRLSPTN